MNMFAALQGPKLSLFMCVSELLWLTKPMFDSGYKMCGPVQTNDTGMIESGDEYLNGLYGGNVKCIWVIKPKTPYKMIMLEITHLSMESSNDCKKSHVKVCLFIFSSSLRQLPM